MPHYFKEYAERLLGLGYSVVPLPPGRKGPNLKGWPDLRLDQQQARKMAMNGSAQCGIGVLSFNTPLIDIDVMDVEIAQRMSEAIDVIFPGVALMTRTGKAPKFGVPMRSSRPFRKLSSSVYSDGLHEHKVEILGDGQQWVAYHQHPETGKPYTYCSLQGDAGILDVPQQDLPELTPQDALRVVNAFEAIASRLVSEGRWTLKTAARYEFAPKSSADPFAAHAEPLGKSYEEVSSILAQIPNDEADYDTWFATLAAIHHELGDAGRDIAYEWSASSAKHADAKFERTWQSLGSYKGRPITFRNLLKNFGGSAKATDQKIEFLPAHAFAARERVEWHIKHVLPRRGLVVVYGAPGSGKSFFTLDLVAHVARGLAWRGHRVRQSAVAYIAAEGVAGFGNRLAAYAKHHGVILDSVPLFIRGGAFSLAAQVLDTCEQLNQIENLGVVVIDTLAAVTPGANENTSEDMGAAINHAQQIIEATGATVILIHHSNKNGEMRGWSGLLAAVDNQVRIERRESLRTAHIEKQKEGEDGKAYGFRLKVVDLYQDEDGDSVSSCVIEPDEEVAPITFKKPTKKERAGAFETSENFKFARAYLKIIEEMVGLDPYINITEEDIIAAIQADEEANPMGFEDTPKKSSIKRTLHTLGEKGKIRKEGRWVRLCGV